MSTFTSYSSFAEYLVLNEIHCLVNLIKIYIAGFMKSVPLHQMNYNFMHFDFTIPAGLKGAPSNEKRKIEKKHKKKNTRVEEKKKNWHFFKFLHHLLYLEISAW